MNWRYKLADWISGGAITEIEADSEAEVYRLMIVAGDRGAKLMRKTEALQSIADMETPRANATVRRMAAVAREALK